MSVFKSNRQTAYAIMTDNKGSFVVRVVTGINEISECFEDRLLCKIKRVELSNGKTRDMCKNIVAWCQCRCICRRFNSLQERAHRRMSKPPSPKQNFRKDL